MQHDFGEKQRIVTQYAKKGLTLVIFADIMWLVTQCATQKTERMDDMNINKLRGKIVEKGMNIPELAAKIGVDRSSMYRKLNNFEKITIGEAIKIKEALALDDSDAYEIFLA